MIVILHKLLSFHYVSRLVCELGTDEEEFLSSNLVPGMCKSLGKRLSVNYMYMLKLRVQ